MKRDKIERFTYQILNIKFKSNHRKGAKAYERIIEDIFANKLTAPTTRGKRVFIRMLFPAKHNGVKFLYGKISRFTEIDGKQDWVNLITRERERIDIPENIFPNLQETLFVFVPDAHRLIIKKSPEFTIYNAFDLFNVTVPMVLGSDEDYNVIVEQSSDIFDTIFNAIKVEKLSVTISYTNSDDIAEDAGDWMDDELKEAQAQKATFIFESTKNESINLDSTLVKGALALAQNNGEATASVLDSQNRRRKIKTMNYPKEIRTKAQNEDEIKNVIVDEVMAFYRSTGGNNV